MPTPTSPGLNTIFTFDPFNETWTQQPDMANGRWYPNQLLLPDGRTIISGGLSDVPPGGVQNKTLEIFNPPSTLGGQGTVDAEPGQPTRTSGCIRAPSPSTTATCSSPGRRSPTPGSSTPPTSPGTGYPHLSRNRQYGNAVRLPGGPSGSDKFMELGGYDPTPPPNGSSFHPATDTTETTTPT